MDGYLAGTREMPCAVYAVMNQLAAEGQGTSEPNNHCGRSLAFSRQSVSPSTLRI